jgi:hypothetical protein
MDSPQIDRQHAAIAAERHQPAREILGFSLSSPAPIQRYRFGNIAWREESLERSLWLFSVRCGKLSFFEGLFRREQADHGQGAMLPLVNDRRQLCCPHCLEH